MESLTESTWDVVIHGTGLHQSLLALALSRSGKKILHVDPEEYYGGPDAALTLQDADAWLASHSGAQSARIFSDASVSKTGEGQGLSFSRAYALPLSPQLIHARSPLLSHLVSSRAFRQLEFLAVGSFFVYKHDGEAGLTRIPSTREAVFSNAEIAPRAKRALMKFLKFVLSYDAEENRPLWSSRADEPLEGFLSGEFKLDEELRTYVLTLTLSHSGKISVGEGLGVLHSHLTSMGVFGPGFAALYPKWGGASEIAQVGCRAAAVGGAVYMLGTGIKDTRKDEASGELELELSNGVTVKSHALVRGDEAESPTETVVRLVAVVDSPLSFLFEAVVEGSPTPTVAVVAFPAGSLEGQERPVYVVGHSSDTGECPSGQSTLYLSTTSSPTSTSTLQSALSRLLSTFGSKALYTLSYTQSQGSRGLQTEGETLTLPSPRTSLSFDDEMLEAVREAWEALWERWGGERGEFMVFEDREGADDDDEV